MADRLCKGCGKTYGTFRSYNAHHSRLEAKPGCRGRHNEQSATATVNSRSYRVVIRDSSFHPEADLDHSRAESDLESETAAGSGPRLQAGQRRPGGRSAPPPARVDSDGAGHDGGWPGRPGTALPPPPPRPDRREALADFDSEDDPGGSQGPATSGPPRAASGSHGPQAADGPVDGGAGGIIPANTAVCIILHH